MHSSIKVLTFFVIDQRHIHIADRVYRLLDDFLDEFVKDGDTIMEGLIHSSSLMTFLPQWVAAQHVLQLCTLPIQKQSPPIALNLRQWQILGKFFSLNSQ